MYVVKSELEESSQKFLRIMISSIIQADLPVSVLEASVYSADLITLLTFRAIRSLDVRDYFTRTRRCFRLKYYCVTNESVENVGVT